LLEISQELEIQPGFCYAAGSVWLYTKDPANGIESCVCSFTGTKSEEHFNLTTHNIERIGGRALIEGLTASRFTGQKIEKGTIQALERMALVLHDCRTVLRDMRNGCDPDVIHFKLRPYLVGSMVSISIAFS
jgi:Indoleamine 2,3-dioxygenase